MQVQILSSAPFFPLFRATHHKLYGFVGDVSAKTPPKTRCVSSRVAPADLAAKVRARCEDPAKRQGAEELTRLFMDLPPETRQALLDALQQAAASRDE